MSGKEITWDLTEIFTSYDDPKISKNMDSLRRQVDEFVKDYKGKINTSAFTAQNLLDLFKKQEKFFIDLQDLSIYANRLFDANMMVSPVETLKSNIEDFETETLKKLTFFELEVGKLIYSRKEMIEDPILKEYKHYLEKIQREVPHQLSEVEEQLILEKDQYGIKSWSELQSRWLNTREYKVAVEGKEKVLSYGEANGLITHHDHNTRISANKSIYGKLGDDKVVYSYALKNICGDWIKITKRRKLDNPMHHSLIANDTSQEIIDNLMKTIEANVEIYRRYLRIKAKLLNVPKLSCADVQAPLLGVSKKKYPWNQTKTIILEAYRNFDITFEEYAKDMFEKAHIDAAVRKGKTNGAYCDTWYKGKTAYILLSFTEKLKEVYTLAHELGHAIHAYLASRNNSYFNHHPGSTVAETASIFGELLLTDLLLKRADSDEEKKIILAHVLDEAGQSAFQVSARVWFEQSLYKAMESGENLDGPTISKYWCAGRDKIYGDSVEWFEEMDYEWAMKQHYFIPNYRYYNYPYVYAQLFVYALYQKYKEEGENFVPKFIKLLSKGGSLSPENLAKIVDLDITKPDFWKLGIKQYEEFVNLLEKLIK